jgi:hypothetical protein
MKDKVRCPVCGDNFNEVSCLANCENVCGKCCNYEPYCQDCEHFNLQELEPTKYEGVV